MSQKIKRQVWLVLWDAYGKWDFIRNHRKGFESIFCSDKKMEATKKAQAIRKTYGVNVKLISAYLDNNQ